MKIKLLETSLNLRIECRFEKTLKDYKHYKEVGIIQSEQEAHIIANVEDMNCDADEYKECLAGYKCVEALDDYQERGVSCYVKEDLDVEKVYSLSEPHLLHVKVRSGIEFINLIIFRILVSDSSKDDYKERKNQFDRVMEYIDGLAEMDNIILTGDWNHGVINENGIYKRNCSRYYFNYQYIVEELRRRNIALIPIEGNSYKDYMKIDHLAVSKSIVVEKADYLDLFKDYTEQIGIPDHKCIVAELTVGTQN